MAEGGSDQWMSPIGDNDSSVVTADGRLSTIDNRTLHHTPAPLAASTIAKQTRNDRSENDFEEGLLKNLSQYMCVPPIW